MPRNTQWYFFFSFTGNYVWKSGRSAGRLEVNLSWRCWEIDSLYDHVKINAAQHLWILYLNGLNYFYLILLTFYTFFYTLQSSECTRNWSHCSYLFIMSDVKYVYSVCFVVFYCVCETVHANKVKPVVQCHCPAAKSLSRCSNYCYIKNSSYSWLDWTLSDRWSDHQHLCLLWYS